MARASTRVLSRPHLVESPTGSVRWSAEDWELGLWMRA